MLVALSLCLALSNGAPPSSHASFKAVGAASSTLQRRSLLLRATQLATGAAAFSLATPPAHASLIERIREGESVLASAGNSQDATTALGGLLQTAREYEGLPSDAMREEVVNTMRAKRTTLQREGTWDGTSEEAYNRLMRAVDPWRVVELQPVAQRSIITFAPAYVALLAVQQLVPKFFNAAYGLAVVVVLGPLFLQIVVG